MTLIIIMYVQNHYNEVDYVYSKVDNRRYLVRKLADRQEAADYLARINQDLTKLVQHMMAKYPQDQNVSTLYQRYSPDSISEGSPESGYTSYSINKGERIILCIRQTDNAFVEKNVVMYVAIHELAHIMTPEIGHTDSFWANFRRLLNDAVSIGLYKKQNYKVTPEDYCGIKITSSII